MRKKIELVFVPFRFDSEHSRSLCILRFKRIGFSKVTSTGVFIHRDVNGDHLLRYPHRNRLKKCLRPYLIRLKRLRD